MSALPCPEKGHLSRRKVLQGGVWSVPAILLATALPAAASSGRRPGGDDVGEMVLNINTPLRLEGEWVSEAGSMLPVLVGQIQMRWAGPSYTLPSPNITDLSVVVSLPTELVDQRVPVHGTGQDWSDWEYVDRNGTFKLSSNYMKPIGQKAPASQTTTSDLNIRLRLVEGVPRSDINLVVLANSGGQRLVTTFTLDKVS